jgi:ATP-dependent Lhr-like helicase
MLTGRRLRENLAGVETVVVDEVHELSSSKRGSQLSIVLERLSLIAGEFQRIGLSATVGSPDVVGSFLSGTKRNYRVVHADVKRPSRIDVRSPQPTERHSSLAKELECEPRLAAQIDLIRSIVHAKKSLIFVNTRQAAEVLGSRFNMLGEKIGVHHGSLSKEARIEAEDAFKSGRLRGLICTSSMELGIDIGDVDHVIQYSSPREVFRLLQRVGRAGHRMGLTATGTVIATGPDDIAEACAIVRRAMAGEIETISIHEKPMDVIANQLVGLTLDLGEISLDRAHEIIVRAYPFKDVSMDEIQQVAEQIGEHRLIWREEGIIRRSRKAWEYYYENLSMIPDEKRYEILDIVSRRAIGTLDEAFVLNFARPGATFVTKGEIWEIVDLADDRIKVVPIQRSGEIPSWTGEEIPVPWDVAIEVGQMRSRILRTIDESGVEAAIGMLQETYPIDWEAASELVNFIKRQTDLRLPVPDDLQMVVEADGPTLVINAAFGHKTNDALGRTFTALLSARFGSSVAMEIDPYRIRLELPKSIYAEEMVSLMKELNPAHIRPILEISLKNTALLRWKMVHVARKFGAIRRDVDYEKISIKRLFGIFGDTLIYKEALREIFHDGLDISRAEDVLIRIKEGEVSLLTSGPSPIGQGGRRGGRDVTAPDHADGAVIELLKSRILNDSVILFCVSCKKWKSVRPVKRVPDQPECPLCGSRMIAALKPWEEEEIRIVKMDEKRKTSEDRRRTKRVFRNANLVLSHGKVAAIALASRGLGPETAARVIRKLRIDEDDFYRDILKAERNYARTKRFWG